MLATPLQLASTPPRHRARCTHLQTQPGRIQPIDSSQLASSLELLSTASELRGSASGRIAIGTIEDPSVHAALPSLIKWFHEHYPLIELSIESRNSSSIRQGILTGEINAGFYVSCTNEANLREYEIGQRELVVVAPQSWRERVATATWPELAKLPWVMTTTGSAHSEITAQLFRSHNITIRPALEVNTERLLRAMVSQGVGLGFTRREFAEAEQARGAFFIVPISVHRTTMHFAYARSAETDPLIQILSRGLATVLPVAERLIPSTAKPAEK
ncbi:LysR family transcriptional regulator substrate-binding protein [Bordetella pertussis]|uniref:LysR family transcriptional regulator substrate-binding protein n=1 Tax=Bordetella pertussis TaxID=520 RepID=UPI0028EACD33|nr:LysR family transcriptional regulator substrate-binding protein [Bordetella pertussis]